MNSVETTAQLVSLLEFVVISPSGKACMIFVRPSLFFHPRNRFATLPKGCSSKTRKKQKCS